MNEDFNIKTASDEELKSYIGMMYKAHGMMERKLEEHANKIINAENEQSERKAVPFWEQNPGLKLAIGDELLITSDAAEKETVIGEWHIGELCYVSNVDPDWKDTIYVRGDVFGTPISLEIARLMRDAYISKQKKPATHSE